MFQKFFKMLGLTKRVLSGLFYKRTPQALPPLQQFRTSGVYGSVRVAFVNRLE
jgi:hypothetical protein